MSFQEAGVVVQKVLTEIEIPKESNWSADPMIVVNSFTIGKFGAMNFKKTILTIIQ
jgi:hypothetical protein